MQINSIVFAIPGNITSSRVDKVGGFGVWCSGCLKNTNLSAYTNAH